MGNRVNICGVDTAALPKMSADEQREMLYKIKNGDNAAREEFVIANIRLVLSVIQKYWQNRENSDDLFQIGCVGLIKAIDNFDLSLNVRFSTYAVPMIIGEIRRHLKDVNSLRVSRSIRDTAYKVLKTRENLETKMGEEPLVQDIAKHLEIPVSEVVYALDAVSTPVSIYEPVYNQGGDTIYIMDQIGDTRNTDEMWIENISLMRAIEDLDKREKEILLLRYFVGKTQIEVSDEVGISQAQVSRLEKNAINRIRSYM
jgi:RNA polymerase sporulation-specific sigma factor